MSKIRWPIYPMHNALPVHKGHMRGRYGVPRDSPYIDSKSIRRISMMCQYKEPRACSQPCQPYNWSLYRSQLKAWGAAKAGVSLIDFVPLKTTPVGDRLAVNTLRIYESNISNSWWNISAGNSGGIIFKYLETWVCCWFKKNRIYFINYLQTKFRNFI